MIPQTAFIVNQAIKNGACGSSALYDDLMTQRENIAALFCATTGNAAKMNQRELYLRVLLEVLKIALIRSAALTDFTEAREDASKKSDQRSASSKTGNSLAQKESHTDTTMRACAYRSWDRHRTGEDQSDSLARAKARANSYSFYRDQSANKSASAEEGINENDQRSEMASLGQGSTDGFSKSQSISHIKPRLEEGEGGLSTRDNPPSPNGLADLTGTSCDIEKLFNPLSYTSKDGWTELFACFVNTLTSGKSFLENTYSATSIKDSSGFTKGSFSDVFANPLFNDGINESHPICSALPETDSLCSETGKNLLAAQVDAMPETFSNDYSGDIFFEFTIGLQALGSGIGVSFRFNLQAGESYSQSARLDKGFDQSESTRIYCSDSGSLSAQKGRGESFAKAVGRSKNDKRRQGEKVSESGSTLVATSTGTMRFSGKSQTSQDKNYSKIGGSTMVKTATSQEVSNAKLVDISSMRMKSVTEYRHQIAKMIADMIAKTQDQLQQLHISKGRGQGAMSSAPELQFRPNSPIGRAGMRYATRTVSKPYPLFPVSSTYNTE